VVDEQNIIRHLPYLFQSASHNINMPNGTRGGRMLLAWPITKANLLKTPAKWPRYLFRRWGQSANLWPKLWLDRMWIRPLHISRDSEIKLSRLKCKFWVQSKSIFREFVELWKQKLHKTNPSHLHIICFAAPSTYVNVLQITNWVDYSNGIYIHSSNYKANGMH